MKKYYDSESGDEASEEPDKYRGNGGDSSADESELIRYSSSKMVNSDQF